MVQTFHFPYIMGEITHETTFVCHPFGWVDRVEGVLDNLFHGRPCLSVCFKFPKIGPKKKDSPRAHLCINILLFPPHVTILHFFLSVLFYPPFLPTFSLSFLSLFLTWLINRIFCYMFGSVLHTLGKEALWGIIRSVARVQGRFSGSQRIACPHLQMPTYFLASMLPRETDGSQGSRNQHGTSRGRP